MGCPALQGQLHPMLCTTVIILFTALQACLQFQLAAGLSSLDGRPHRQRFSTTVGQPPNKRLHMLPTQDTS